MLAANISNPANRQEHSCYEQLFGKFAKFDVVTGPQEDHELIVALVAHAGTTPTDVARRAGMPASTVNRHFKRPADTRISRSTLAKLQGAFPDFPGWANRSDVSPESNAEPVKFEGASLTQVRRDMPVYGTALGAERVVEGAAIEQTMLNQGEVIEYRKRPPISNGIERVYGLYVQGSSMYPAHRDGAFLFAQWDVPLRVDDDVVVYLRPLDESDDGLTARAVLVKRLRKRTAQYVELEQFNPQKIFRIPMAEVVRIDRVLTLDDYA